MTYGQMQTRIASEINRTDITSNIQDAIITAIRFYRKEKFWFNQTTDTVTATIATRTTALPSDWEAPVFARLQISTSIYQPVSLIPYSLNEEWYLSDSMQGIPDEYSIFGSTIYWRPIPIISYTVYLSYIKQITEPTGSNDTSSWFTDAEALIREHAKGLVYQDVLYASDKAAACFALAKSELSRLKQENAGRNFNSRISASW